MTLSSLLQIRQSFSRAALSYRDEAAHQAAVSEALVSQYLPFAFTNEASNILDLGCGTGFVKDHFYDKGGLGNIFSLDLSEDMLRQNPASENICADFESLPFQDESFDLCVSSYAFQWAKDFETLFSELNRVLKPGGMAFFSVPAPGTFIELEKAWSEVDQEIHVHSFEKKENLLELSEKLGFKCLHFLSDTHALSFEDQRSALNHIKGIGAHNLDRERPKHLMGKERYKQFSDAFREQSKFSGAYSLTYQSYFIGLQKQ